ncbi:hypothetical protein [Candidatus Mycolicibacterium alkanivorans]|uniref:Uncharacterized protein n=1 Tax=Candidatus Mycolicibacterium alkanivorans TaxID=2954114 RepID=A0ABS9YWP7_9MYCO|nr:hypothetical protein [Candidatus Mycolicibacterium alkanivorans]MCI4675644.1 hypothetical protein [Candidatus Mycolicibacterium alkanivorans]
MTPVELVCSHHVGGGAASFHPLRLALADFLFRSPEQALVATIARVAKEAARERNALP